MTLTALAVKNAKPLTKPYKLFDGRGLFLLVNPNGSKWWRFKYRYDGKEKLLSLGTHPEISLADARERRDQARQQVAKGIDPSAQRRVDKQFNHQRKQSQFEFIAEEWFKKNETIWSPDHGNRVRNRLARWVYPSLGQRPITEISVREILDCMRRIEREGKFETAHRALNACSQIFRFAVQTDRVERDICSDLRGALIPSKPTHRAAVTDPEKVGLLLRKLSAYNGSLTVKAALNLVPHVFVRPGELRKAKWADIDLEKREWRFIVGKTNTPHIVPLSERSMAILTDLYAVNGNSEFVFPGARSSERPMSNNAVLAALRSLDIPKEEMCGHGFRAMARTLLDEVLGARQDLIEHQLSHRVKDPLGRAYNRTTHLSQRREMMESWSKYLDQLLES